MDAAYLAAEPETDTPDQQALLLMLSYIEAECRRLGALDTARHAALAASALPVPGARPAAAPVKRRLRGLRLH